MKENLSARNGAISAGLEKGSVVDESRPGIDGPRRWLGAAFAVATVGWGANQFAPLLLMYQRELGVSSATVQAVFALYGLALIPGLLLGGPVSDRYGRRPVMILALFASFAGTVLLIVGGSAVAWLFAGRAVAGVASGAAFSSGAAWLKELSVYDEVSGAGKGAGRVTVAMTVGFGAGPFVAGVLAQWAPAPLVLPYVPHLVMVVSAFPLVLRTAETRTSNGHGDGLWRRLRLPGVADRRFLLVVVPLAPWVFASATIGFAFLPGLVAAQLGGYALVFSAVVTFLTAAMGIAVQPLARRAGSPTGQRLIVTALSIVVLGTVLASMAARTAEPILVVAAALVLGAGYGTCQVCGLIEVQRVARPDNLAGLTAAYQAISYLGLTAPFVLATLESAMPADELLMAVAMLAALTLVWTARHARSSFQPPVEAQHSADRQTLDVSKAERS